MKTKFDLENDINAIYSTSDDLAAISQIIVDKTMTYDTDKIFNVLNGFAEILYAKTAKLEDTFKQVYCLDEYK